MILYTNIFIIIAYLINCQLMLQMYTKTNNKIFNKQK